MSLVLIAMTGILVGFLCIVIGFFMEDAKDARVTDAPVKDRRAKTLKKKMVVPRRKAA